MQTPPIQCKSEAKPGRLERQQTVARQDWIGQGRTVNVKPRSPSTTVEINKEAMLETSGGEGAPVHRVSKCIWWLARIREGQRKEEGKEGRLLW